MTVFVFIFLPFLLLAFLSFLSFSFLFSFFGLLRTLFTFYRLFLVVSDTEWYTNSSLAPFRCVLVLRCAPAGTILDLLVFLHRDAILFSPRVRSSSSSSSSSSVSVLIFGSYCRIVSNLPITNFLSERYKLCSVLLRGHKYLTSRLNYARYIGRHHFVGSRL